MGVHVSNQFVAFLGRRVEADRKVNIVFFRERYFLVGAVYGTGRGINKVGHLALMRLLQQINETREIALYVKVGIFQRVSYAGLRCQMDDGAKLLLLEHRFEARTIRNINLRETKVFFRLKDFKPGGLESIVVIRAEIIQADYTEAEFMEPVANVKTNEARATGHQYTVH